MSSKSFKNPIQLVAEGMSEEIGPILSSESAAEGVSEEIRPVLSSGSAISKIDDEPPLLNWKTGPVLFFFALAFNIASGFINQSGGLYFVAVKKMSQIWFTNVTIVTMILSTILTLIIAPAGDNLSGKLAMYGRRKPFVFVALPLLVAALLMIGQDVPHDSLELYYLLMMVLFTCSTIPGTLSFQSWLIESAADADDFNNLQTVGVVGGIMGATLGSLATQAGPYGYIRQFSIGIAALVTLATCLLLLIVPARVLQEPPKMPPLVASFRTCTHTKEFRMIFLNEVLLQIALNGVVILVFTIFYTCFHFTDPDIVNTYVFPVFGAIFVCNTLVVVITNRLISRGVEKITIYKVAVLAHAFFGFCIFCSLIPSIVNYGKVVPKMFLEADIFVGFFVLALSCAMPIQYIQNLLRKDLITFDYFLNKKRRENVYQTALQLPASLLSSIVVNFLTGILFVTGYEANDNKNSSESGLTLQELYSWNLGTIVQLATYALLFSVGIGLLSFYVIKDYPLTTPLAKKLEAAVYIREQEEKLDIHMAPENFKTAAETTDALAASTVNEKSASVKDEETDKVFTAVSDSLTSEEQSLLMLHFSSLECKSIAATADDNGDALAHIRFRSYICAGFLGTLALGWLTAGGVEAVKDGSPFVQIIFTLVLMVGVYVAYEIARARVIRNLSQYDQNYVRDMARQQVALSRKYSVTLEMLMDEAGIDVNELDEAREVEGLFARMTLSARNAQMSIFDSVSEAQPDGILSGYNKIYLFLLLGITAGVLFTYVI